MSEQNRLKGKNIRRCVVCGRRSDKSQNGFIRVVRPKDGRACIDPDGCASGRGAYVCRDPECVEKLCHSRRLSRCLHGDVPESLYDALRGEVAHREP